MIAMNEISHSHVCLQANWNLQVEASCISIHHLSTMHRSRRLMTRVQRVDLERRQRQHSGDENQVVVEVEATFKFAKN